MPQHYQLLKPRLNLGPSATAHVDYAKYLSKILVSGIHTSAYSFFLKNGEKILKEHLEHLDFLRSCTYNAHKKFM